MTFNDVSFIKWVGRICLGIGILTFASVIIASISDYYNYIATGRGFMLILVGTIIMALGRIAENLEDLHGEMKFFRRHYIQKDNEVVQILKEKARKRKQKD